jgi:hypothetical protein
MTQIINTSDQLKAAVEAGIITKRQAVAVSYSPRPSGRMGMAQCDKSQVFSPFFKTDPDSAWYDYGNKTFSGNRAESFPRAKAWASDTYGITDWKPNKSRCHVPAIVQERFPIRQEMPPVPKLKSVNTVKTSP